MALRRINEVKFCADGAVKVFLDNGDQLAGLVSANVSAEGQKSVRVDIATHFDPPRNVIEEE